MGVGSRPSRSTVPVVAYLRAGVVEMHLTLVEGLARRHRSFPYDTYACCDLAIAARLWGRRVEEVAAARASGRKARARVAMMCNELVNDAGAVTKSWDKGEFLRQEVRRWSEWCVHRSLEFLQADPSRRAVAEGLTADHLRLKSPRQHVLANSSQSYVFESCGL